MSTAFPSFEEFFQACADHAPYPWQARLAEHIQGHGWPELIDVPTGLGKTAGLLAGIYEVARQVHEGLPRTAPQRILHVVDRKIVIDQTHTLLQDVAERIAAGDGVLAPIKTALSKLAGPWGDSPLAVARIHSDARDLRTWMRPTGVCVLTLTTHQAISRMLFRGLGVSERTRSVHAGLLGVDCAIVVDEPHLSHQAVATLRTLTTMQSGQNVGVPSSSVTLLGASTPATMFTGGPVISLDQSDLQVPAAQQRVEAARPVHLTDSVMKDPAVAKQITILAKQERAKDPDRRIGIIVNSVSLAQQIFKALPEPAEHKALVTSRFRPIDRQDASLERRTLVATQTVEVGVDVSFDALITEEAPWPSLVQRLGRLNRDGSSTDPAAHLVLGEADSAVRPASAAVYGDSPVLATRMFLTEQAEDSHVDLSVQAQRVLGEAVPEVAWPPAPRLATFHQGFFGTMTATYPTPFSDMPLTPFIVGPEQEPSLDVAVCWREDPLLASEVPPLPDELVSVPLPAVRAFLTKAKPPTVSDMETEANTAEAAAGRIRSHAGIVVIRGAATFSPVHTSEVRPGDVLVLPTSAGGYDRALGWDPGHTGVVDDVQLAAFTRRSSQDRALAVLSAATYSSWAQREQVSGQEAGRELRELLQAPQEWTVQWETIKALTLELGLAESMMLTEPAQAAGEDPVIVLQKRPTWIQASTDSPAGLQEHQVQVADTVQAAAQACGLNADLSEQTRLAGRWHDQGKAHQSFQAFLGNTDPSVTWAKSKTGTNNRAANRAQALSVGHPLGWRHEGLSAAYCEAVGMADLVVHLVASHHGRSRPLLFSPVEGDGQTDTPGAGARFSQLNEQFGPWGLAYLEALLRLGDWHASANPAPVVKAPDLETPELTPGASTTVGDEVPLFGLTSSLLTGWYALAGLLHAAHLAGHTAHVRWTGTDEHLGVPVWCSDLSVSQATALVADSDQWEGLERLSDLLGKNAITAKNQNIHGVARIPAALDRAADQGTWSALALLQDWMPAPGDKAALTLPAQPNNSSYVGRAVAVRHKDPTGTDLARALLDPLSGWEKGGSDGGFDRANADVGVTGWESMQDIRPSRAALAPAALLGMAAFGAAGPEGVGPDASATNLALPVPQHWVSWTDLAALSRGVRKYKGWVLEARKVKPTQYMAVWTAALVRARD